MENITDWLMVVITAIYVIATIIICIFNQQSVKTARKAVDESKKQFQKNIELQKQHNYDSVRPAVSIDFSSLYSVDTFSGSVTITNHGLGPAIIKELKFKKNDREYINTNGYCTLYDLICFRISEENEELAVQEILNQYYSKEFRNENNDKDYLAVGEKLLLLKFSTRNKQEAEIIEKVFHGVHMELTYTDIYNSCDWKTNNRLSYFKPRWID